MSRIEELKKQKRMIISDLEESKESLDIWKSFVIYGQSRINLCTNSIELIDDEIRLEELVYFCLNGSYPDEH
jgi:hypothetical protein